MIEFEVTCPPMELYRWYQRTYTPGTNLSKRTVREVLDSISNAYGEQSIVAVRTRAWLLGILDNRCWPKACSNYFEGEQVATKITLSVDRK